MDIFICILIAILAAVVSVAVVLIILGIALVCWTFKNDMHEDANR